MKLDFSGLKILVIGDPMVDIYHFGHVDRVSPEAPVPVFVEDKCERRDGGAANVLRQLVELGCNAYGAWDHWGQWSTKHRYMVGNHQLLRVDADLCVTNSLKLPEWSYPLYDDVKAIVISDYAKGSCTPEICQEAIKSGLPVIVDPKGKDWEKYRGCRVICPNTKELELQEGPMPTNCILQKRGAEGLRLHNNEDFTFKDYPSVARHVFDITGAGDTVVAVIAACIARGIEIPLACKLANIAAGYVVGEVGTTICPIEYLCSQCASL